MTNWSKRFTRIFGENAERTFFIDAIDGGQTSYGELARNAAALAQQLESRRLRAGDRIGIHLPNGSLFATFYFACLLGGFTAVPVNNALSLKDRAFVLGRSRLSAIVTGFGMKDVGDLLPSREQEGSDGPPVLTISKGDPRADLVLSAAADTDVDGRLAEIDNDRLLSIHFTSGTTSLPKGVAHRAGGLLDNASSFNRAFGLGRDNRFVHVMPMPYMAGFLNTLLGAFTAEASIILAPQFGPQSALRFWDPVAAHGGDTIWMSPTMLATLTRVDRGRVGVDICQTRRMRIFSATAPLARKIQQEFEEKYGVNVVESYGLSELLLITANDGPAGSKMFSVGTKLPEVRIEIRGDEGQLLAAGTDGAIFVNTPYATVGYIDFETGFPISPSDQWFDTGDVGHVDTDGYLFVTGRVKDLIIRGGFNISPRQIEEVLLQHPAIDDVAVVGVPHEFYGEQIVAVVIPAAGSHIEDIQAGLREHCLLALGKSALPDLFIALDAFPVTNLGKIQKNRVREMIVERMPA
ncbi:class I adenylate-forming enzyme family protein [Methylocystis sp. B8]|uniref:class I adenylate-forming enzyme family protein n=1 Tax=Methylocystis sp. B8 TaxID=544938 RepID=UPI0010FE44D6|nr:class I adenylate-forming enzyme family protein [Methylocystis sp. B8]TLG77609.1 acyl--CoA ligase [Methylocystis sp. B8]